VNDLQVHTPVLGILDVRNLGDGVQGSQILFSLAEGNGRFRCIAFFDEVTGKCDQLPKFYYIQIRGTILT